MKKMILRSVSLAVLALFIFATSCTDKLEVENLTEPDAAGALQSASDVVGLAAGAMRIWHNANQEYSGPALAMATMADQMSCSWGNAAMKDLSSEPRSASWNNKNDYPYSYVNREWWQSCYGALSQVNDALVILNAGEVDFEDDAKMLEAMSRFMQGVIHGYVGLTFDKGYIIDETTDLAGVTTQAFATPAELAAAALGYLDQAIAIADANTFTLPDGFVRGMVIDNVMLSQLANSFAARIMVYTSRNATEDAAVNWSKVLTYAQNGIDFDFGPDTDDSQWWDNFRGYGMYPGWVRVDHRIINLMDTDYPSRWPDLSDWGPAGDPGEASSDDDRLAADFEFLSDQAFRPDRGHYHFSHYRHNRYATWLETWTGFTGTFLKAENDMLIAEAMVKTGNVAGAVTIINNGTRTTRGGLADLVTTDANVALDAIFYERDIELILTGAGIAFYDMRRRSMLQSGTIQHWPLPSLELESLNLDYYTISGAPDGVNIANGSWTGKDGTVVP